MTPGLVRLQLDAEFSSFCSTLVFLFDLHSNNPPDWH